MTKQYLINQLIASANNVLAAILASNPAGNYSVSNGFDQWSEALVRYVLPHIPVIDSSIQVTRAQYMEQLREQIIANTNNANRCENLTKATSLLNDFLTELNNVIVPTLSGLTDEIAYLPVYGVDYQTLYPAAG
jgi:hypothetical protein